MKSRQRVVASFVLGAFAWAMVAPLTTHGQEKPAAPPAPPYASILKDAKNYNGLMSVWQKGSNLLIEMGPAEYNNEFIVLISISRGIGRMPLLGGYSWGFGDDWVWTFRKIDDKVHLIRKNVRFRANKGTPEATAVNFAYTDSILFSLPIVSQGPKGGDLVDFTPVFMSDLPQISQVLPGFAFARDRSNWAAIKPFKDNMELEVAATYASGGQAEIETVPDSRGATINVHYSISRVPATSYQPRLADDRVGYFMTVVKDFSKQSDRDQFTRYINRWHLERPQGVPDGPAIPVQPIIFWIEKTVPFKYRKAIRDGIAEWNKAFEAAGWLNAVEVRQQPANAEWDPEDINFNTFRWITSNAGFAMGPSRVNPYNGQILDADIIFDADFLTSWRTEFETLLAHPSPLADDVGATSVEKTTRQLFGRHGGDAACMLRDGMSSQLAFGATAIDTIAADPKVAAELQDKLIMQGLKEVTMHEVGHTLGLRHNFKASKWLSLKDLNDPEKAKGALAASVMDYTPTNIVPKDWKQGDFYMTTLGPYDMWAIEYGYKPLSGGTQGEVAELKKIASRSGEPGLTYATDEDTRGSDPDPDTNRFDLGADPLEFARIRSTLVTQLIPGLVDRMVKDGDDYTQARRAFSVLLNQQGRAMEFVARYIGGLQISRSHKGDKDAKPPYRIVDAKMQREALTLLEQQVLNDKPFQFPPELYNQLGYSRWEHWGTPPARNTDVPVHAMILQYQESVLGQLLSSRTLTRLHDAELKVPADQDALTTAELIERLTKSVFAEVDTVKEGDFNNRKPAISSLRRNLQRSYLRQLSNLALTRGGAPDDCQTIAFAELGSLKARIEQLLKSNVKLDSYSRAHLQETAGRIQKVLEAQLITQTP
ncbi:MAG TPA: zinc-dependent metalloprotease [Pirellulaceae bacterium]|nr:zinc-dependent metalloprotease [Pirellulaceae bacterium]